MASGFLTHRRGPFLIVPLPAPTPRSTLSCARVSESDSIVKANTTLGISNKGTGYKGLGVNGMAVGKGGLRAKGRKGDNQRLEAANASRLSRHLTQLQCLPDFSQRVTPLQQVLPCLGSWNLEPSTSAAATTTDTAFLSHLLISSQDTQRGSQMAEEHRKSTAQIRSRGSAEPTTAGPQCLQPVQ